MNFYDNHRIHAAALPLQSGVVVCYLIYFMFVSSFVPFFVWPLVNVQDCGNFAFTGKERYGHSNGREEVS